MTLKMMLFVKFFIGKYSQAVLKASTMGTVELKGGLWGLKKIKKLNGHHHDINTLL